MVWFSQITKYQICYSNMWLCLHKHMLYICLVTYLNHESYQMIFPQVNFNDPYAINVEMNYIAFGVQMFIILWKWAAMNSKHRSNETKKFITVNFITFLPENLRKQHLWLPCLFVCYSMSKQTISADINSLRPRRNGHFNADDIFKCIFLKENVWNPTKISLKFVPKGPINNIPALVQIMAWRHPGDRPLSEPMMVSLLTHICITRPQWVNP